MQPHRLVALVAAAVLLSCTTCGPAQDDSPYPPLGLNLAGNSYWATEHCFKDLMKHSSRWRAQKSGEAFSWDWPMPELAEDGYPLEVGEGNDFIEAFVISAEQREHLGDELVALYEGTGKIDCWGGAKVRERAPGRDVWELLETGPITVRIVETDPDDHVRNVRILKPSDEATYEENPFRQAFLDRWKGMQAFRFMDWGKTNNSEVSAWEDRALPTDRTQTQKGIALEYQVDVCNRTGIDPWFCIPHLADDDYVRNAAELVEEMLAPELTAYVEYSNEVWNGQFAQARWAAEQGQKAGLSDNRFQAQLYFYSKRSVEIFRIWQEVFGEDSERLVCVLGTQAANPWVSEQVVTYDSAFEYADALAGAPYFGHRYGSPETQDEVVKMSMDDLFAGLAEAIEANRDTTTKHAELCEKHRLTLMAYEGGQHLCGHGGAENNQALTDLFIAANRDPRMRDMYLQDLRNWREAGGDLFMAFSSMGRPSKWGSWCLLEYETQDPGTAPKYQAIQEVLEAHAAE